MASLKAWSGELLQGNLSGWTLSDLCLLMQGTCRGRQLRGRRTTGRSFRTQTSLPSASSSVRRMVTCRLTATTSSRRRLWGDASCMVTSCPKKTWLPQPCTSTELLGLEGNSARVSQQQHGGASLLDTVLWHDGDWVPVVCSLGAAAQYTLVQLRIVSMQVILHAGMQVLLYGMVTTFVMNMRHARL